MSFFSKILRKKGYCSAACMQGQGCRADQQDSFLLLGLEQTEPGRKSPVLAMVADGVGGAEKGGAASALASFCMTEAFRHIDVQGDVARQLDEAVMGLNKKVFEELGSQGGSTIAACIVYDERLYFSSLGDSGIYLLRDEQLSRLNVEHNAINLAYAELIGMGCTDPEQAEPGPAPYALTRFLGMAEYEAADSLRRPMELMPGDRLLVCSDGVDGSMPEQMLIHCLSEDRPEKACALLEQAIVGAELPYQDNYTALVLMFGD